MKPGFRHTVESYRDLARDEVQNPKEGHAIALGWRVQKATEDHDTPREIQEKIYDTQVKKQQIMQRLHETWARIDRNEIIYWSERPKRTYYVWQDGPHLWARMPNGANQTITLGSLLTDGMWGTAYVLDSSVTKHIRKQYVTAEARREITELLNVQIATNERSRRSVESGPKGMYTAYLQGNLMQPGHVAEHFSRAYLKKLIIDHDLPFEVVDGDIHQDAEQKIDFLMIKPAHERDVIVKEVDNGSVELIGIQLATGKRPKKTREIGEAKDRVRESDGIHDILLIKIGRGEMLKGIHAWKEHGCPPGGPDAFVPPHVRETIFRRLLHRFFLPTTIEHLCKKIQKGESSIPSLA